MKFTKHRTLTLLLAAIAMLGIACDDGSENRSSDAMMDMIDTSSPDGTEDCSTVENPCDEEGTTCDGDTLIECTEILGCLVENETECDGACDDSGETAMCEGGSCEGKELCDEEAVSCDGDTLVECALDGDGCLVETETDCAANSGGSCDSEDPRCVSTDPMCEGKDLCAAEGKSCDGGNLVTCAEDADGCLVASETSCGTNGCSEIGDSASCGDGCLDDPDCSGREDGEEFCNGQAIAVCLEDEDGCLVLTETDCAPELCEEDPEAGPQCEENGEGDSCEDPIVIQGDATIDGAAFALQYSDEQELDGTGCEESDGAEAIFEVTVTAGEELRVFETGGLDAAIHVLGTCEDSAECLASELDEEDPGLVYMPEADGTVFVAVEVEGGLALLGDFSINFEFGGCGNGKLGTDEECDDGGDADADGCNSMCELEFGFDCNTGNQPTTCQPYTDLGVFAPGDAIDDVTGGAIQEGMLDGYLIEFTGDVELDLELLLGTMGDASIQIIRESTEEDEFAEVVETIATPGDEEATVDLDAGVYAILVIAGNTGEDVDSYTLTLDTAANSVCPNGLVEGSEECDDNNMTDGDGCTGCMVDDGFDCVGVAPSVCTEQTEGETCGSAIDANGGGDFSGSLAGARNDYDGDNGMESCTGEDTSAPDEVYAVDLTAGQTLSATLDSTALTADLAIAIVSDCGDIENTCLAGSDDTDPELVEYTAAGDETVFVIVDSTNGVTAILGNYDLNIEITDP